ncbi:hypothetical protein CF319_g8689 [Tilletia indica]|nr:hypothetical protein CF319_g8689 [Tilletia indica]
MVVDPLHGGSDGQTTHRVSDKQYPSGAASAKLSLPELDKIMREHLARASSMYFKYFKARENLAALERAKSLGPEHFPPSIKGTVHSPPLQISKEALDANPDDFQALQTRMEEKKEECLRFYLNILIEARKTEVDQLTIAASFETLVQTLRSAFEARAEALRDHVGSDFPLVRGKVEILLTSYAKELEKIHLQAASKSLKEKEFKEAKQQKAYEAQMALQDQGKSLQQAVGQMVKESLAKSTSKGKPAPKPVKGKGKGKAKSSAHKGKKLDNKKLKVQQKAKAKSKPLGKKNKSKVPKGNWRR